jgi:hypothetical protein
MSSDRGLFAGANGQFLNNPWPALALGLTLTGAAGAWFLIFHHAAPLLVFGGLLASGVAVNIRARPLVLGLAALSGLVGWFGLSWDVKAGGTNWDSARLLVLVLTAIAGLACVVVILPHVARRIVLSLLVLFHFGGIVTAVTNVPPNPWLSNLAWAYVYRPYLEFFYLGNAYHFYSPDPGPGIQIWFYVQYEDGAEQQYLVADRDETPLKMEYQRRISLAESVNQKAVLPLTRERINARVEAGLIDGINFHPDIAQLAQYIPATPWYSARLLESYVRYVARHATHPTGADRKIAGIKVYRAEHDIIRPNLLVARVDPESPWLYRPYYLGDFTADGELKDPNDPYLYWLIPIVKEPIPIDKRRVFNAPFAGELATDFLERHRRLPTGRFKNHTLNIPDAANGQNG